MQQLHQLNPKNRSPTNYRLLKFIIIFSSLCIIYFLVSFFLINSSKLIYSSPWSSTSANFLTPTTISHVVFGIAANEKSWPKRQDYVKHWWRPDLMRGCVFLENPVSKKSENETSSLPPICISGITSRFSYTKRNGYRSAIRVARVVLETVMLNHTDVRWFVFGDDDTVFFWESLVKTLSKYDHRLWHYIGTNSEIYGQNKMYSFGMAFGGGGFVISYPLARILAKVLDSCLERYPHLYGSDGRIHACIAELGIGLTKEPGFHQMDVRGNLLGLLSAHPNTPLVSLHHLDHTDPIFPNMTTIKALEHLLEASRTDPHRLLQQTVCYYRWFTWTVSVSWGYAVQIFDRHLLLPDVLRTQHTFRPWNHKPRNVLEESFSFDTTEPHSDPCRRPAVFFFDGIDERDKIKSVYRKMISENCSINDHSPRKITEVRVSSRKMELDTIQVYLPFPESLCTVPNNSTC